MTHPVMAYVHLALAGVWCLLIYPTVRWWRDSVTWVVFMSLYAVIISHLSAFAASE